ncbi:hypothetical protein ACFFRR_006598 [Megaselia abdita]
MKFIGYFLLFSSVIFDVESISYYEEDSYSCDYDEYIETVHYGNILDHPCNRECSCLEKPRKCNYFITVENFDSDLADGRTTNTLTFNRTVPGPAIIVCQGDMVVIEILNLSNMSTSVHWHGLFMRKTQYADGPAFVTQYPIGPGTSYIYKYNTKEEAGTFWYHPHHDIGRCLGCYGALIIKEVCPKNPDNCVEHIIFVADLHLYSVVNAVDNIVINGKGRQQGNTSTDLNQFAFIEVQKGKCVKFRFILNFCSVCTVEMYIPDVTLNVVASDGHCLKTYSVQSIRGLSAERFDAIATFDKVGTYWLNVKACNFFQGLRIIVTEPGKPPPRETIEMTYRRLNSSYLLNGIQFNANDETSRFSGAKDIPMGLAERCDPEKPALNIYETRYFSLRAGRNGRLLFGDISYESSDPYSILQILSLDSIDKDELFCDLESELAKGRDCKVTQCNCTHVIDFDCGKYYEIVIYNFFGVGHPMHFHGHNFSVSAQGYNLSPDALNRFEQIDRATPFPRRPTERAPVKDTVTIPPRGYVALRFLVDNSGPWFWHCHFETHSLAGMELVAIFCRDKIKAQQTKAITKGYCPKNSFY